MAALDHAVTLQALDEDRLGEELTVVWELKVGRTGILLGGECETPSPPRP
ncbi:MAG: hypothetical protein JXA67_18020 [Micromonosporaceae bacterium]|nr:hypothetical protein [Micromonosporaceae bacterium]